MAKSITGQTADDQRNSIPPLEWQISLLPQEQTLLVKTKGNQDASATRAMLKAAISAASEHRSHRFLFDTREANAQLNLAQLYDVPKQFRWLNGPLVSRIAIVLSPEDARSNRFQALCGANFPHASFFGDYDQALAWVTQPVPFTDESHLAAAPVEARAH